MKFEEMCRAILSAVGGSENITSAYNCMTRLRLVLKDQSKCDEEALKNIKGVLGVNVVSGQTQCIIGPNAGSVCAEFCEIAGIQRGMEVQENLDADKTEEKKKLTPKSILNAVIAAVSGCIQPLLPIIICGGMLKLICSLIGPTIFGLVSTDSNVYRILEMAGDAPFYFLPIMIGYTGAKYFNTNIPLGMLMGALLLHPTLTGIVAAGEPFTVFGIPMTLADYSSSVVPMILCMWIMSYIEKFFRKIIPDMVKMMLVNLCTILVMLPLGLCVLAPLGTIVGNFLGSILIGIPQVLGPIGVMIVCTLYPLLIVAGMHLPVIMACAPTYFALGHEECILVADSLNHFSVMGVCLAFALKAKKKENKSLGMSSFIAITLGGVVEPGLFGIELPHRKLLITQLLATGVGGLVAGIFGVGVYTLTSSNIMNLLAFVGGSSHNAIFGIIACVVAFAAALVGGFIVGFTED